MNSGDRVTPFERETVRMIIGEFLHLMDEHAERLIKRSSQQVTAAERIGEDTEMYERQLQYARNCRSHVRYMFAQLASNRNVVGAVEALRQQVHSALDQSEDTEG